MPEPPAEYRWKPGQSGNPGGRSKKRRLDNLLRDLMAEDDGNGKTVGRRFLEIVIQHAARDGNPSLIKEIFDRHDGKVPDRVKAEVKTDQRGDFDVVIGGPPEPPEPPPDQAEPDPTPEGVSGEPR